MNDTITATLKPDFEILLYKAAHQNLADIANPLRLSNFAYAMRELVVICLNGLHQLTP